MTKKHLFAKGIAIAIFCLIADQLHKYYMIEVLNIANSPITVTPYFDLVMVWNYGISFGMFQSPEYGKYIFLALSGSICSVLLVWLKRNQNIRLMWALGLIIGGAIGNVIDRFHYGAVADFFHFHIGGFSWPAFNIADSVVFIGAAVILIDSFFYDNEGEND